jgi:hypothetical protein
LIVGPCAKILTTAIAAVSFIALSSSAFALQETTVADWKACVDAQIVLDNEMSARSDKYGKVQRKLEDANDYRRLCLFGRKTGIPNFQRNIKIMKGMLSDFCSHPATIVDATQKYHKGVGEIVRKELTQTVNILEAYKKEVAVNCAKAGID